MRDEITQETLVDRLKNYFKKTSIEQAQKDWDEAGRQTKGIDSPTVAELLDAQKEFNKQQAMKHNIIKTDNYLLVVDDSEIKEGDWYLTFTNNEVMGEPRKCEDTNWNFTHCKKIIAHLLLNNSPILEGVDLLPPLEDEVEKLVYDSFDGCDGCDATDEMFYTNGYIKGYNKAKEKYSLTLDKLLDLYIEESGYGMDMWSKEENTTMNIVTKIIQSLQQPKYPVAFECAVETHYKPKSNVSDLPYMDKPKATTNLNGQTVWVGKYIF